MLVLVSQVENSLKSCWPMSIHWNGTQRCCFSRFVHRKWLCQIMPFILLVIRIIHELEFLLCVWKATKHKLSGIKMKVEHGAVWQSLFSIRYAFWSHGAFMEHIAKVIVTMNVRRKAINLNFFGNAMQCDTNLSSKYTIADRIDSCNI